MREIQNLQQILENLDKKKQEKLKSMSPFVSESSSVMNSQLNSYESTETIIIDQGSYSYNNQFPISVIETSNTLSLYAPPPKQVAFQTWSSIKFVLNICGGEAQFCICASKKQGVLTKIAFVLQKHMIDVLSINIMCHGNGNAYMILVHLRFKLDLSPLYSLYWI
ncbi:transcription factor bHLH95-like [Lathyrus oleraceus]|uniref:transcription factor bHLH95-like n=1 Tax=Pisum sativum TaxID=3888 RepID=UPI0021D0DD3C|nr:transcription factor bHLH95-like [Pisum sativum]